MFKKFQAFDKKFGFQSMSDNCQLHSPLSQVSAIYGGRDDINKLKSDEMT
jgi:hypothetical protein